MGFGKSSKLFLLTLDNPSSVIYFSTVKQKRGVNMSRDEIIKKFNKYLNDETGDLSYDGFYDFPEHGNSFKLVIIPAPGRHTATRETVCDAVLRVVKSHFPSECIATRESSGKEYPSDAYIITVSDYTRYHD